ncbi:unnamed product [Ostreococcus tauri]|uniref:Unnamed product n=1 Tax=Ostreococcus tauri TaxID=70448 RepID=Q01E54_OSTTA|nr:unnamed product [Ostreococcus tauri]CAL52399.1 unnamed product [Ostreococcus tauri]|eukprot:XP_003075127.1 unnamed product [Ostreococcus tauri]
MGARARGDAHRPVRDRRRARARVAAKKRRPGGGGANDYSDDFALYGSFDESYADGAGMILGKNESGRRGKRAGGKRASYDAVAGVLEALSEVRTERRQRAPRWSRSGGDGGASSGDDDEEAGVGSFATFAEEVDGSVQETPREARPAPVREPKRPVAARPTPPRPKAAPKPKLTATVDPVETKAKATQTLCKWGFAASDIEIAIEKTVEKVGDSATAKKRQIAALDWLLMNCPMENVPDEYRREAQQVRG